MIKKIAFLLFFLLFGINVFFPTLFVDYVLGLLALVIAIVGTIKAFQPKEV